MRQSVLLLPFSSTCKPPVPSSLRISVPTLPKEPSATRGLDDGELWLRKTSRFVFPYCIREFCSHTQLWTNAYKDNLRLYNARMHSYKQAGNLLAKDMTDQEAATYADEHGIGADNTADAQLVGESSAAALNDEDAEGEPDKEPTPPPKTPKSKGGRKTKASKNNTPAAPASPETIVPPASSSSIVPPKPAEKEKSPDKKRKRATKKDEVVAVEKEELAVETPKSAPKPRKKKAKADS